VDNEKLVATQIGLHSVCNILGNAKKKESFKEHHKDFCEEYGLEIDEEIDRFGVDLTEIQSRVMEGILYGFSRTSYKGNTDATSKEQFISQRFSGKTPDSYKYIEELPKMRVTQSEILEWSGINKNSIAAWSRAVEAIRELGEKQYCFYYDRLVIDNEGNPVKDSKKRWAKEEVVSVDTLFSIKEIRDKSSGALKYYEIMPSAIFLDQREGYFMFIPLNWRDEVKQLVGNKKASSYTFRFLLFLRYQYELKRRINKLQPPYTIKWSSEEIARAIKMPASVYLRKKKRANEILGDAYSVAKQLGYLNSYQREEKVDILVLNDQKYFNARNLAYSVKGLLKENSATLLPAAISLFEKFYKARKELDPQYEKPSGNDKREDIIIFQTLLEQRKSDEIERVIDWSTSKKYWCTHLSTPKKLKKSFSEAWAEMMVGSEERSEAIAAANKELAKLLLKKNELLLQKNKKSGGLRIDISNKYVEIITGVTSPSICVDYSDKNFKNKFKALLLKYGLSL